MADKIISVDLDTKENMKKVIDNLDIIYGDHTCCSEILDESLEILNEIKKKMRVFVKPKKDSKTFSIRINSEDSKEAVTAKLNRMEEKIKKYKLGEKIVQT